MAQIFPKWTVRLPLYAIIGVLFMAANAIAFIWYYASPMYTDVGYRPKQPVPYSHKLHAGDLGIDCRYCHTGVENAAVAGVPPAQTCLNCHTTIEPKDESFKLAKEDWLAGVPTEWVKVHKSPDYVYFNHGSHIRAGVGCYSCHGNVSQMEEVQQVEPLSMSWCLDCHRSPEMSLRPANMVTDMEWTPPDNQMEIAKSLIKEKNLAPPEDCSGCHR